MAGEWNATCIEDRHKGNQLIESNLKASVNPHKFRESLCEMYFYVFELLHGA